MEDLEQKSRNNSLNEDKEQTIRNQGLLISLVTGAVTGLVLDQRGKIELTPPSILLISTLSGLGMPFLLNYDKKRENDENKEKESFKTIFMRNPYYFTGMLAGLTAAKIINQYVLY